MMLIRIPQATPRVRLVNGEPIVSVLTPETLIGVGGIERASGVEKAVACEVLVCAAERFWQKRMLLPATAGPASLPFDCQP